MDALRSTRRNDEIQLPTPRAVELGPWMMLADALQALDVEGFLYHRNDDERAASQMRDALNGIVALDGGSLEFFSVEPGSLFQRFKRASADLAKEEAPRLKRAAEVQLHEKDEAEAAQKFAEALARLTEASQYVDEGIWSASNVLVVKAVSDGKTKVVGRVLSPRQIEELKHHPEIERSPILALAFLMGEYPRALPPPPSPPALSLPEA
jgi:hypothetical protein